LIDEQIEQFKAQVAATTPLGRAGTPNEIAKTVVFLASDDSSYVNDIELFVDGGTAQILLDSVACSDSTMQTFIKHPAEGWKEPASGLNF